MPSFTNQATLSYDDTVILSNTVTGQLRENLTATKTAVQNCYGANGSITYVISLVNTGCDDLTDLTVTDDLGAYPFDGDTLVPLDYVEGTLLYFLNGALRPSPDVEAGPPLVISGVTVPARGNTLLIYEAEVNQFAPPGADGEITNTVTITGEDLNRPLTAEETVEACSDILLSISKSLCPSTVAENGRLTYTFVIQNFGNRAVVATDDAVVTDTFDPILTDLEVVFEGDDWTEGDQYTYSEVTGLFATTLGEITVPAATFAQNDDGVWVTTPGVSVLTVTGTI